MYLPQDGVLPPPPGHKDYKPKRILHHIFATWNGMVRDDDGNFIPCHLTEVRDNKMKSLVPIAEIAPINWGIIKNDPIIQLSDEARRNKQIVWFTCWTKYRCSIVAVDMQRVEYGGQDMTVHEFMCDIVEQINRVHRTKCRCLSNLGWKQCNAMTVEVAHDWPSDLRTTYCDLDFNVVCKVYDEVRPVDLML
ncbi:hypothetical protein ABW19_dt0207863 [Dactylella cylindrospora]|nr:hypothetical protein ABW19_dt0207863 [Dactylella cylindrospora]